MSYIKQSQWTIYNNHSELYHNNHSELYYNNDSELIASYRQLKLSHPTADITAYSTSKVYVVTIVHKPGSLRFEAVNKTAIGKILSITLGKLCTYLGQFVL